MSLFKSSLSDKNGNRRSFRLSSLEILLAALVVVGVVYLAAAWLGGLFGPDPETTPVAAYSGDAGQQLNQALARTEKALAQLDSLRKDQAALNRQVKDLAARPAPKAAAGGPDPALVKQISGLEKRLAGMRQDLARLLEERKSERDLAQRVDKLAATTAALEKEKYAENAVAKSLAEQVDKLSKQDRGPAPALAELAGLEKKVADLEKTLAAAEAASKALDGLEKRLARLEAKYPAKGGETAAPGVNNRLNSLEAGQKVLRDQVDSAGASLPTLEARLNRLETAVRERPPRTTVRAPLPDRELAGKVDRLERLVNRLEQSAASGPDAGLARRQAELDSRLAALAKSQERLEDKLNVVGQMAAAKSAAPSRREDRKADLKPQETAEPEAAKPAEAAAEPQGRKLTHKVRRGETLYGLARRYGVSVDDLRRWNPKFQKRSTLYIGENLLVYVSKS